jgi:predicted aspartyl protease
MSDGHLVSQRFPYLPVRLDLRLEQADFEALLDTGFDGDMAIPAQLIASKFPPDGHLRWTLADGSSVSAPYYIGSIEIAQVAAFPGVITALGDEAIVGVGVASHLDIILDHGRRVVVEP